MLLHTFLLPVAAFAVTMTGANAFNSDILRNAGLSESQIEAFAEARELVEAGDREAARDVLADAGIDANIMNNIRAAWHEYKIEHRSEVVAAVEANDYNAFQEAIEGSPLADIINTEAEFELFVEAHALIKSGDRQGARDIFEDLGLVRDHDHDEEHHMKGKHKIFSSLSDDQRAELKEAFKDRDHEQVREILKDAGVEFPGKGRGFGLGLFHRANMNDN